MSFTFNIPFFSLFLTLLSAISIPLFRKTNWALHIIRAVQLIVALLSFILLIHLCQTGESFTYMMGHFPAPWGNELKAGPLEALMALTFSLVMFLSLTGGAVDLRNDVPSERQGLYCLLMQLLYAALLAMVYTNDLFTAYVFIEIAALTACIAVAGKESGRSIAASIQYLVFSTLGSGMILLGISILYSITGHLLMENLALSVQELAASGQYTLPLTASALLMVLGMAIKSAQFPFHSWLPDAHANATTSASAILSGLVLKGYIVLLLKLILRIFGSSVIIGMHLHDLLFLLGLAGMIYASVVALQQEEVKRMIAYSSTAQIAYIFLAFGFGTEFGIAAGCFQILAHAFTKSMLFVSAGAMIRASGDGHYWHDLRGAGRADPIAGIGFTVGALSMCGLPLLAGFSAKYAIALSALTVSGKMLPALLALALSSVLNALYYVPAILVIWKQSDLPHTPRHLSDTREHSFAILCMVGINIVLGVALGPITAMIQQGLSLL